MRKIEKMLIFQTDDLSADLLRRFPPTYRRHTADTPPFISLRDNKGVPRWGSGTPQEDTTARKDRAMNERDFEDVSAVVCDRDSDGNPSAQTSEFFLASIAISLKRIADVMEAKAKREGFCHAP